MTAQRLATGLAGPGVRVLRSDTEVHLEAAPAMVPGLAARLVEEEGCEFATLVVEHRVEDFELHYFFHGEEEHGVGVVQLTTHVAIGDPVPAISDRVHAADWDEREAEDLFEIHFAGHPFLGDFVLHDTEWREGVAPLRRGFDPCRQRPEGGRGGTWAPRRVLDEPGALVFPVGPVWGGDAEAGLWLLETPGEEIRQVHTRLFYKHRGVEKIAEGRDPESALLLAERFSGNAAFGHGLAFCQALEAIAGTAVPRRAVLLRTALGELERMRYHATVIAEIAGSTALAVAKAWGQELEEELLRLSGEVFGHRYLFGVVAPGGLARDIDAARLERLRSTATSVAQRLDRFEHLLERSSSFLDRLEEMGTITPELARSYGTVGPVGRASGRDVDLRQRLPYAAYHEFPPRTAGESEGDGYARLRVFFQEAREAARLVVAVLEGLPEGPVRAPCKPADGVGLGWVESPAGAAFHWLRVDEQGLVRRWRAGTPAFRNWHAFHRAVEGAAFQDFPIVLASFGLSIAENDR
ncbi:MAG: NADH-quinone oxidoreductase subunit C [Arenicellales bacterium]